MVIPIVSKTQQGLTYDKPIYISVVGFGPKSHYRDLIGRTALGLGYGV